MSSSPFMSHITSVLKMVGQKRSFSLSRPGFEPMATAFTVQCVDLYATSFAACSPEKTSSTVCYPSVQFSSLQSHDRLDRRGDMRDGSAEILFQSFLQQALVSSSGMGRVVHSLMLSIQHFLCRPRTRRPPSKVP